MSIEPAFWRLDKFLGTLRLWYSRARERQRLSDLDDQLLRDLGLSRERARLEGGRPFWRGAGREHIRGWNQPRFTAFSEKESARRGKTSPVAMKSLMLGSK